MFNLIKGIFKGIHEAQRKFYKEHKNSLGFFWLAPALMGLGGAISGGLQSSAAGRAAQRQRERSATQARWSPFTGVQPEGYAESPSIAQGLLGGLIKGGETGFGILEGIRDLDKLFKRTDKTSKEG